MVPSRRLYQSISIKSFTSSNPSILPFPCDSNPPKTNHFTIAPKTRQFSVLKKFLSMYKPIGLEPVECSAGAVCCCAAPTAVAFPPSATRFAKKEYPR